MKIYSKLWGKNSKNEDIYIYTLENKFLKVEIINIGGIIKKIEFKDENKGNKNLVINYDNINNYELNPAYIGAIIGRNAGRIENGILNLPSSSHELTKNNGNNNLHGGFNSISHKLWDIEIKNNRLSCKIKSPDLENGFPGNIDFQVEYILKENEFIIEYNANSDRETYINMTNHTYFNLSGENALIYNDILKINSDYILKINESLVPYELMKVENSIFDFREEKKLNDFFIGDDEQKKLVNNGIDHPFILNKRAEKAISIYNEKSGIKMEVETDNPAVVIYTANYFKDISLNNHSGICFETQEAPNLFRNQGLEIYPSFTDKNKPYKRYTKFIFSQI